MNHLFKAALDHTLIFEGGYSHDPDDPGGATNYGISLRFLSSLGDIETYDYDHDGDLTPVDIQNLTRDQVARVYHEYFWNPRYEEIAATLAVKLFDFSVNMGVKQATKLLQRALECPVDGIYGSVTHRYALARGLDAVDPFIDQAARFYFTLADRRPTSRKYLFGWLRRAYA